MVFDMDAAFKSLESIETDKIRANEKIAKLISAKDTAYVDVDIGGEALKIYPTLRRSSRDVLRRMHEFDKTINREDISDEDISTIDKLAAILISTMCFEEPFDDPRVWMVFGEDSESMTLSDVVGIVLTKIAETQEDIKSFRKVRGRTGRPKSV